MPKGVHNSKRGRKPLDPEERTARRRRATRKAAKKWWRKEGSERRARSRSKSNPPPHGLRSNDGFTVTSNPDRPLLRYLDTHGHLHTEKELSAEELIHHWKERHP